MSRTFTKFLFAVTLLFGLLNNSFADKYKATMTFSGIAKGTSENVDAEIVKGEDGLYTITFIGVNAEVQYLGSVKDGSLNVTALEGTENNLTNTSGSKFEFVGESLDITSFNSVIDADGTGSGSFEGTTKIGGFMSVSAGCEFTLTKVVDNDTIVQKELSFDNVPFYNKVVDLTKVGDTTKTNNDSTAVGIALYNQKASFAMNDFEISVAGLKLSQKMLLENLTYGFEDNISNNLLVSGTTSMYIDQYKMYVPAVASLVVSEDGKIDGTIEITVNIITYNYKIIVVFGSQAEGVVVETKTLAYEKTNSYPVKSDKEFVNDTLVYINENGILIENIKYSIVDQTMTLLIKEYAKTAGDFENELDPTENYSVTTYSASKAEAYILVNEENVYLKDVDIIFDLKQVSSKRTSFVYGSLTILDGGPATNEFIDTDAPYKIDGYVGQNIVMYVDTTGNNLDGYTSKSTFSISGVYDYVDGEIKTVTLADFDAAREAAIAEAKLKDGHGFPVSVVATDKAGNSTEFKTTCYAKPAPVYIEETVSIVNPIREIADSITGKATIKLDSLVIVYTAKNDTLGLSEVVNSTIASVVIDGETYSLPTTIEMEVVSKKEIKYVWENPYTGESKNLTSAITVYESPTSYAGVANVANKTVSVFYKDGNLVVNGVNNANVSVVNLSGATVYTGKAGAINLHKGIYIVKVAGKAYKVVVK